MADASQQPARNPSRILLVIGAGLFGIWLALAIAGPAIAPFNPGTTLSPLQPPGSGYLPYNEEELSGQVLSWHCPAPDLSDPFNPTCGTFWLGTNHVGQDTLSRILYAYRWELVSAAYVLALSYGLAMVLALLHRCGLPSSAIRAGLAPLGVVPPVVTFLVLVSVMGLSVTPFAIAFAVASLPSLWRHHEIGFDHGLARRSRVLWWIGDVLSRFALCLILLETLAFLGRAYFVPPFAGPWFPGEARLLLGSGIARVFHDAFMMMTAYPTPAWVAGMALLLPILSANLLAAALWARLPHPARQSAALHLVLFPRRRTETTSAPTNDGAADSGQTARWPKIAGGWTVPPARD